MKMSEQRRLDILRAVISESGAKFIETNVVLPQADEWEKMDDAERERFTQKIISRFKNVEAKTVETPESVFGFDVSHCHFAALTRTLDRAYLAPLFCQADSVYFNRPEVLVQLNRKETLAQGDHACTFRFEYKDQS